MIYKRMSLEYGFTPDTISNMSIVQIMMYLKEDKPAGTPMTYDQYSGLIQRRREESALRRVIQTS